MQLSARLTFVMSREEEGSTHINITVNKLVPFFFHNARIFEVREKVSQIDVVQPSGNKTNHFVCISCITSIHLCIVAHTSTVDL